MSSTAKRIEEMSDGVEFERLALAVLRRMMPDCHAVIHESANADGKPIASKVDAFATVSGSHPARCVVVACTTEKRKGIKAKWLFDHQNPEGEYVGTHFFGTPVKHASLDLLKQIGGSSLEQRQAQPDFVTATKRVPRAIAVVLRDALTTPTTGLIWLVASPARAKAFLRWRRQSLI